MHGNSKQLKLELGDSLFWQKDEQKDEGDSAQVTQKSEKSIIWVTQRTIIVFNLKGGGAKVLLTGQRRKYQPGAVSRRDIGAKHRLDFIF